MQHQKIRKLKKSGRWWNLITRKKNRHLTQKSPQLGSKSQVKKIYLFICTGLICPRTFCHSSPDEWAQYKVYAGARNVRPILSLANLELVAHLCHLGMFRLFRHPNTLNEPNKGSCVFFYGLHMVLWFITGQKSRVNKQGRGNDGKKT